jgi:3-dehydroquinate synthase
MGDSQLYKIDIKSSIRDYSVFFIDSIEDHIKNIIKPNDIIICDDKINVSIKENTRTIKISASEKSKSFEGVNSTISKILDIGLTKNDRIICIGGGTIQDLGSFIASILFRGIDWIFYPTTLLSQGDSCIGSKTSINFGDYKNQLGNFYPPASVFIDINILQSLDDSEIRSGIGEMSHYFFIKGGDDLDFFIRNYKKCLEINPSIMDIIYKSLLIKKEYIEIDEFDKGPRIIFNYGHTFGHSIESIKNYSIPHGIAVSIGMDMANYVSFRKGYIKEKDFLFSREILKSIWNGFGLLDLDIDLMISFLKKDKKNEYGKIGLILTKGPGNMFKELIDHSPELFNYINDYKLKYIKKEKV